MNPGRMDRRITIQALTTTPDALGSSSETWSAASGAPTWAEYIPLRGMEQIEAGKVAGRSMAKFRIRYWSGLTRKHRVVCDGRTWNIRHFDDYKRQGEMVLLCEEVE